MTDDFDKEKISQDLESARQTINNKIIPLWRKKIKKIFYLICFIAFIIFLIKGMWFHASIIWVIASPDIDDWIRYYKKTRALWVLFKMQRQLKNMI